MANSILTISQITREALRILHQKCQFIGSINRQYDSSFANKGAKIGDTLRIRLPNQYTVTTGATFSAQDTVEQKVDLTVATQKHVGMNFTTAELTLSMDDFSRRIIEPAMSVLAADIEADAISQATKATYNLVGTAGTVPNALSTYLGARTKIQQMLAPPEGRSIMCSAQQSAAIVDALKGLFNDTNQIGKQYKDGMMGRTAGFDWFESESVHTHTNGTQTMVGTVGTTVSTDGTSTLVAAGMGASKTIKAGTVFTVAGVYSVHPQTKNVRSSLQQFVVTADATSDGSGAATLTVSPAMYYGTTARQNISAAPASGAALTGVGSASTAYEQGLAFHRDAFTFATADLVLPDGVDMKARETYDGISMRVVRQYDFNNDKLPCRVDVLYGFAALRPEHACRVTS